MFARSVSIRLRQGTAEEFNYLFENEAIPLLREQDGFQQVITLINPDRTEVVALSLWSERQLAEAYHLEAYGDVLERLADVLDGSPLVTTYEVCNSTVGPSFSGAALISERS